MFRACKFIFDDYLDVFQVEVSKQAYHEESSEAGDDDDGTINPRDVGHNIYILAHQLARHNRELAEMLKPEVEDEKGSRALEYYAKHTAQIEVRELEKYSLIIGWLFFTVIVCFVTDRASGSLHGADRVSDSRDLRVPDCRDEARRARDDGARRAGQQGERFLRARRRHVLGDEVAEEAALDAAHVLAE